MFQEDSVKCLPCVYHTKRFYIKLEKRNRKRGAQQRTPKQDT